MDIKELRYTCSWDIALPKKPAFGRDPCKHRIANHPDGPYVFDDWLDMNIQSGSQWDGFRHYGHQRQGKFYNNLTPAEVLSGENGLRNTNQREC
jgi:hypothetical protein